MRKWTILHLLLWMAGAALAAAPLFAADFNVPARTPAGQDLSITTSGSGAATFYLVGDGTALKKSVNLGENVNLSGDELQHAGRCIAILKSSDGKLAKPLYIAPQAVDKITFLARPSRVPTARPNAISGVAFVFDRYLNLVLDPVPVKFELTVDGKGNARTVESKDGVAWLRTGSGNRAGAAQFVASAGDASVRRVVQQTAAEPCNIRMHVEPQKDQLRVFTDPIRDCSGNPVPDGTIVSFIQTGGDGGRSTVDARIKKGFAEATLPAVSGATITVASGVVLGNEVRWGGQR